MLPNFLDTASAGEWHHLLQQQVSMTMRFNSWDGGTATPTNYMRTFHNIGFYPSLPAFTGPFHMVNFSSLHLSTSHSLWLEHDPLGAQKSRSDSILKILPSQTESIDGWTLLVYVIYARGHMIRSTWICSESTASVELHIYMHSADWLKKFFNIFFIN